MERKFLEHSPLRSESSRGAKVPWNESSWNIRSEERKFHGSESSMERKFLDFSLLGANVPWNESSTGAKVLLRSMQINHSTECTTGVGNQKRHSQWNSSGCNKHICSAQVLFTYSTVDCKFGKYFTPKLRLHLNTIFSGLQVTVFSCCGGGRLILQCDLYADKFISMPLNLGQKTTGLLTGICIPVVALMAWNQFTVGGWGI